MRRALAARAKDLPSSLWPVNLDYDCFPSIVGSFAYGSGVFRQEGYSLSRRPMVDLIFVVRDREVADWHRSNVLAHPTHYASLLRSAGPGAIARVQGWGPGLYYNTHVSLRCDDGSLLSAKYGVMTQQALLSDLTQWGSLYAAGRLHKPVVTELLGEDTGSHEAIVAAMRSNRRAALGAALLDCALAAAPGATQVSLYDLLSAIVGLSYAGDVRVGIAEDTSKVGNIVRAQHEELTKLYLPLLAEFGAGLCAAPAGTPVDARTVSFDHSPEGRQAYFGALPSAVQAKASAACASRSSQPWDDQDAVRQTLGGIVRRASVAQSAKGVLTAGLGRSARYLLAKLRKRFA